MARTKITARACVGDKAPTKKVAAKRKTAAKTTITIASTPKQKGFNNEEDSSPVGLDATIPLVTSKPSPQELLVEQRGKDGLAAMEQVTQLVDKMKTKMELDVPGIIRKYYGTIDKRVYSSVGSHLPFEMSDFDVDKTIFWNAQVDNMPFPKEGDEDSWMKIRYEDLLRLRLIWECISNDPDLLAAICEYMKWDLEDLKGRMQFWFSKKNWHDVAWKGWEDLASFNAESSGDDEPGPPTAPSKTKTQGLVAWEDPSRMDPSPEMWEDIAPLEAESPAEYEHSLCTQPSTSATKEKKRTLEESPNNTKTAARELLFSPMGKAAAAAAAAAAVAAEEEKTNSGDDSNMDEYHSEASREACVGDM